MNWGVIGTLVAKDISLYFKNRFFALITVLALVAYTVVFFVMPASVNETVEIGIYAPNLPVGILDRLAGDGVDFVAAPSREAFEATILGGDQPVGLVLEAGTVARLVAGQQGRIEVLFATALPEDFRDLYTTVLGELGFLLSGRPLAVEIDEQGARPRPRRAADPAPPAAAADAGGVHSDDGDDGTGQPDQHTRSRRAPCRRCW